MMTNSPGTCKVVGAHAQFFDLVGMLKIELHVKQTKKLDDLIIRAHIQFHNVS